LFQILFVGIVNAQTILDNPDLQASCGFNIMLALDESESITAPDDIREAILAFLNVLLDTRSEVALLEFDSTTAKIAIESRPVTSGVQGTLTTVYEPYLQNNYQPSGDFSLNWEEALKKIIESNNRRIDQGMGAADLNIFLVASNPPESAIDLANVVKKQGSHLLVVGIVPEIVPEKLKFLLGATVDKFPDNNIRTADMASVSDFTNLETALSKIAAEIAEFQLCRPSLSVTKLVNEKDGQGFVKAEGWEFTADVKVASPNGMDYVWVLPDENVAAGKPGSGITDQDGLLKFQWDLKTLITSKISVTETVQKGYTFDGVSCEITPFDTQVPEPLNGVLVVGSSFTIDAIGPKDIVNCEVRNTKIGIAVGKTALPRFLPEPGGSVTYAINVINTLAVDDVTVETVTDPNLGGDISASCTPALPVTLPPDKGSAL
jgi:hypothetical protein